MNLKSLELTGFKSFAKKTELNFKTPITAVVGPNGSGKSNIAEAFRFVLGEQSIKSMRGKRTEDLIWNGGGDASRANRASVKVFFDNHKRLLNVDFDEVSIERAIYRDSSSEYFINGTQVRLRDIIELLGGAHIGSSGHHIISQGEADKILNASPKERREMVEDALGLKVYQYKKEESERKLLKTSENMKSVESLRREIAPHLKFLQKQVEKIEHALKLKDSLMQLCLEYFKREKLYLSHQNESLLKEKSGPEQELQGLESELKSAKEILSNSSSKDAKSNEVIKLESELSRVREEKDQLMRTLGRLEGTIESQERMWQKEKNALESAENQSVLLKDVEKIKLDIENKILEVENKKDSVSVEGLFSYIRNIFSSFILAHKTKTSSDSLVQMENEIKRMNEEKKSVVSNLSVLNSTDAELNKSYAEVKADIEKEQSSSREAERAIFKIMGEENRVRNILSDIKSKEEKLKIHEADLKHGVHEAGLLLGRDVLEYENFEIKDEEGRVLNPLAVAQDDRAKQEERKRQIERMKIRVEDSGALGADEVQKEHREVSERDAFLARELIDLEASATSLKNLISELGEKLDTEFRNGVSKINDEFSKFFGLMFGGGEAHLKIVREIKKKRSDTDLSEALLGDEVPEEGGGEDENLPEGIDIEVSLPRKKIKGLVMLSGGERALTSIALLFSITRVNPPPFVILDETDAALDEANSKKYGDMIENLAKLSQLILITHNRETMSRAGVLYGVTMGQGGASKLLSIAFDEAVAVAK